MKFCKKREKSFYCKGNFDKKKINIDSSWHAVANKILILLVILLGVGYVASVNDLAIKGFVIQELKGGQEELAKENKKMELKVMSLESFDTIDKKARELKMVQVDKIDYITLVNGDVAKK